jgi:hypothetical protein
VTEEVKGARLIYQALAGIPEASRCQCEHVPVAGKPGVYEVAQGHKLADSEKPVEKVEDDAEKAATS